MIEAMFAATTEGKGCIRSFAHLMAACRWQAFLDNLALPKRLDAHRQRAA